MVSRCRSLFLYIGIRHREGHNRPPRGCKKLSTVLASHCRFLDKTDLPHMANFMALDDRHSRCEPRLKKDGYVRTVPTGFAGFHGVGHPDAELSRVDMRVERPSHAV